MINSDKLASLIVGSSLVDPNQLAELKKIADSNQQDLGDILLAKGLINIEELIKLKAKISGLQYQFVLHQKIDESALNAISLEVAENYKIACLEKSEKKIRIGLTDSENFKAIEAINFLAKEEGLQAEYCLISKNSFDNILKQYKTLNKEISTALKFKKKEEAEQLAKLGKQNEIEIEEVTKTAPVAKIVSVIIKHAVEGRASDIHIEPMQKESRVRYRIDGILHTSLILPKNVHSAIVARIKVMAELKLDETRIPQGGRIRMVLDDKEVDLRVSILPLLDDEKVVMRILDVNRGAPTLEDLGFMGNGLEKIKENIKKKEGMFLITGPTGSGKSTTLFSILNGINKEDVNIVTLEDPVEYFIKGINQSQIRPEIGYTFASGLRSFLRQDPDVIMVGEIRDNETAELAIHASLTGHFVLSTLHTNDALGTIPRLLDMGIESFLLGSTLNVVVAQRLGRKICSHCKAEETLPAELMKGISEEINNIPATILKEMLVGVDLKNLKFYKGRGCSRCGNTGYTGRIALIEVLDITKEIRLIIMEGKKNLTLEEARKTQQFTTIKEDGIIKVLLGLTSMEEVLRILGL
ncbi:MAG: GspE/PulE family protein [Patescibacteria group bacterium]